MSIRPDASLSGPLVFFLFFAFSMLRQEAGRMPALPGVAPVKLFDGDSRNGHASSED
jgi:hypothetical protein